MPARRHLFWAVPVSLALAVRLLHLLAFRELPYYRLPFGDAKTFVLEAERMRDAGFFGGTVPFFQGPLYPSVLALLGTLGLPVTAAYWIQCVTGAVTVACVYAIASRLASRPAGLVAATLYALYDGAVFFDADLLAASLTTTLVAMGLSAWLAAERTDSPRRAWLLAGAGVAFGLVVWGRANLVLPIGALAIFTFARRVPGRAAFLLPLILLVAIPCLRNSRIAREPTFVATSGGVNFFIGNHVGATGLFAVPPESGLVNERELAEVSRLAASRRAGRELTPTEASRAWLLEGLDAWRQEPLSLLRVTLRKIALFVSPVEVPNHLDLWLVREQSGTLAHLPVRAWLLIPAGVAGLFLLRGKRPASALLWFLVLGAASVVPFFVTARYRLFAMPLLAVGAGVFLDAIRVRTAGAMPLVRAGAAGSAVLLAGILAAAPATVPSVALVNLGALHLDLGEPDLAEAAFRRALAHDPEDPRALENLAVATLQRGDAPAALGLVERALTRDPSSHPAWNVRGVILGELGRFDEAIAAFERSLALFPANPDARANLARTWALYERRSRTLLEEAGLAPTAGDPASIERAAAYLAEHGYARAAERLQRRDR